MQIPASVTRLGAASATPLIGAPVETDGAGFASLLRQRLPTPEPTLAAPPRTPAPAAPESAAPAPASGTPAPVPNAADAPPPDGSARAPTPSTEADAGQAATRNAPATAATTTATTPTDPADAALRSQLRARLRGVDAAARNDPAPPGHAASTDAAIVAATPTAAAESADPTTPTKKATQGAAIAPLPDPSALPSPAVLAPPVTAPPSRPAVSADALAAPGTDARAGSEASRPVATGATDAGDRTAGSLLPSLETPPAGTAFAGVLAEQREGAAPARPSSIEAAAPTAVGAAAFGAAPSTGTAAPQAVALTTPVAAPNFAQELGVKVSVLAGDGVQQAELHLNPADMGPVSVQITLDGTQARIDFGADVAATRHAIESGLPQLAGALADAGFTLAGGGVSSHAGGRGDGGGARDPAGSDGPSRRSTGVAATEAAVHAVRRVVSMGGLDLYA